MLSLTKQDGRHKPGDLTSGTQFRHINLGLPSLLIPSGPAVLWLNLSMPIPRVYFSHTLPSGVSRVMSLLLWEQFASQCSQPRNKAGGHIEEHVRLRLPWHWTSVPGPVPCALPVPPSLMQETSAGDLR